MFQGSLPRTAKRKMSDNEWVKVQDVANEWTPRGLWATTVACSVAAVVMVYRMAWTARGLHRSLTLGTQVQESCGQEYTEQDTPRYFVWKGYDERYARQIDTAYKALLGVSAAVMTVLGVAVILFSLTVPPGSLPTKWKTHIGLPVVVAALGLVAGIVPSVYLGKMAREKEFGMGEAMSEEEKRKYRKKLVGLYTPMLVFFGIMGGAAWFTRVDRDAQKRMMIPYALLWLVLLLMFIILVTMMAKRVELQNVIGKDYGPDNTTGGRVAELNAAITTLAGVNLANPNALQVRVQDYLKTMIRRAKGSRVEGEIQLTDYQQELWKYVPHARGKEMQFVEDEELLATVGEPDQTAALETLKTIRARMADIRNHDGIPDAVRGFSKFMFHATVWLVALGCFVLFHLSYQRAPATVSVASTVLILAIMVIITVYSWVTGRLRTARN